MYGRPTELKDCSALDKKKTRLLAHGAFPHSNKRRQYLPNGQLEVCCVTDKQACATFVYSLDKDGTSAEEGHSFYVTLCSPDCTVCPISCH